VRRLVWSPRAIRDVRAIRDYIAMFNPRAAADLAKRLEGVTQPLLDYPEMGRMGRHGVRELVTVHPYLVRYRVTDEKIEIVTIRHGARRRG